MGMFRGNTTSIGRYNDEEVPVIEGYSGAGAYLRIIAETTNHELSMFDESMMSEMRELAAEIKKEELEAKGMIQEAAEIVIVTEGAAEIKAKLKNLVLKAWQKIKSLYEAIKVRVGAFLTRDYNKFYKKHEGTFTNYAKNTKGKYTFKMPKASLDLSSLKYGSFESKAASECNSIFNSNEDALKKKDEEISDGSYITSLLGCSKSEYKKEILSQLFEDKDTYEELTDKMVNEIKSVLGTKDIIANLNKAQKANNDYYKKLLSEIDKIKGKVSETKTNNVVWDTIKHDDEHHKINSLQSNESGLNNKRLNVFSKVVSVNQTANNIINGEYINLIKMHIAQCKSVFTKVVSRSKFTEQVLLDAIEENAIYESLEFLNA